MTIGAQLKAARVERHLSCDEVSRATKIQPWVLEALESDRLQEQMSPIYAKGFLISYARFLHLDPAPLLVQLQPPSQEPEMQELLPSAVSLPKVFSLKLKLPHLPPIAWRKVSRAVVVATAAVAMVFLAPRIFAKFSLPASSTSKLASVTTLKEPKKEPKPEVSQPTLTLLSTQPLELSIEANRTTWVRVRGDGKLLTQQRLERGAKERWVAKKRLELVVAKPSLVSLTLNGQPINAQAISHNGRLLITHHGITQLPEKE